MGNDVLRSSTRLVLALPGSRGPVVSPMAFWFDGASLWMTTSVSSVKARILRTGPRCAVWIPPADDGDRGVVAEGPTRMFSAADPVGLATHWPAISAAMTAFAVKQLGTIGGYVVDLPRLPLRWLPPARVVVRMRVERLRPVRPPVPGAGIAPALPGVVPADVRRILAGRRDVVVAAQHDGGIEVRPAVWGAGFRLDVADAPGWPDRSPLAVVLDDDPRGRPSDVVGLTVFGPLRDGRLAPERVAWWDGFSVDRAEVPSRPAGGIVIPD